MKVTLTFETDALGLLDTETLSDFLKDDMENYLYAGCHLDLCAETVEKEWVNWGTLDVVSNLHLSEAVALCIIKREV